MAVLEHLLSAMVGFVELADTRQVRTVDEGQLADIEEVQQLLKVVAQELKLYLTDSYEQPLVQNFELVLLMMRSHLTAVAWFWLVQKFAQVLLMNRSHLTAVACS